MRFRDRAEAASLLADELERHSADRPLVLGIPRGGVPMASLIARRLDGDLDVMLVHKLRAPFQPELAVGSVDEAGRVYLTPFAEELGIDAGTLEAETQAQLTTLRSRRARYTAAHAPAPLSNRTVILVDDGLATGSTAIAAIRAARAAGAARVIIAVGVAPPDTITRLRREADEVVCLYAPHDFAAVGQFFEDFSEVTDDEVVKLLARPRTEGRPSRPDVGAATQAARRTEP
jgi:predicted phosphoribosyltransferase